MPSQDETGLMIGPGTTLVDLKDFLKATGHGKRANSVRVVLAPLALKRGTAGRATTLWQSLAYSATRSSRMDALASLADYKTHQAELRRCPTSTGSHSS